MLRSTHHRGLCLGVTLLFGGALVGAAHHRATARHGYCTEHGKLIHVDRQQHDVDGDDAQAGSVHPRGRTATTTHGRIAAHPLSIHGSHDCLFLAFLAQPLRPAWTTAIATADQRFGQGPVISREEASAPVELLRLAPKSSPPFFV